MENWDLMGFFYLIVFVLIEKFIVEVSLKFYLILVIGDEFRLICKVNKVIVEIIWKKVDDVRIIRVEIDI